MYQREQESVVEQRDVRKSLFSLLPPRPTLEQWGKIEGWVLANGS